jgi:hypothetical protein
MTLKVIEFCPSVDALTLLQFRSEAFQAWRDAPLHQDDGWRQNHSLITDLLEQAGAGPVRLDLL